MKTKAVRSCRVNKRGMTLLEIALVVALLLSLIAILFLGIAAYKKGADRAKCLIQLSSIQKVVRSYQSTYDQLAGAALVHNTTLMGSGLYFETVLSCPDTDTPGAYTYMAVVPVPGTSYTTCSLAGGTTIHNPTVAAVASW